MDNYHAVGRNEQMPRFRKKTLTFESIERFVIEAMQFTEETKDQVLNFVRCNCVPVFVDGEPALKIQTLEGEMTARLSDWVIKGVKGEFYPCKSDIFEATYEPVEESEEVST